MVIVLGRRREHPNQHFVLLLLKKYGEKSTGKKLREKVRKKSTGKKYGKKVRGKKYGKIWEKSKGKSHVTSDDITSGQACAMVISSGSSTNAN